MEIFSTLLIIIMSFFQGAQDFINLPLFYYFKDSLMLSPTTISFIQFITLIPWQIKFLCGYLSDTFPLFNYKRKSYIIMACIIEIISLFMISLKFKYPFITVIFNFFVILALVFRNVIGEAIIVQETQLEINKENLSEREKDVISKKNVSLWYFTRTIGSIIFNLISGFAIEYLEFKTSRLNSNKVHYNISTTDTIIHNNIL